MRDCPYCPYNNCPWHGPVRARQRQRTPVFSGVGADIPTVDPEGRQSGWVEAPIQKMREFANELCNEAGMVRRKQLELVSAGVAAASRLTGLRAIPNPTSAQRKLIEEYETIRVESRRLAEYIYQVQVFGAEGFEICSCQRLFDPRRCPGTSGLGAAPVAVAVCAALTPAGCAAVVLGVVIVSVAGLVYVINKLISAFNGAEETYRKTLEEQYNVMREICDKALQDPTYLPACEKAQGALKKLNDNRPPTLIQQFLPAIIAGVAVIGGVAVVRSAMRNAAKRRAAKLLTAE